VLNGFKDGPVELNSSFFLSYSDPPHFARNRGYGRIVTYNVTLTQEGLLSNTGRSRKKLSCGLSDRSRRSERGKLVSSVCGLDMALGIVRVPASSYLSCTRVGLPTSYRKPILSYRKMHASLLAKSSRKQRLFLDIVQYWTATYFNLPIIEKSSST
jgi:hypothetical protein